MEIRIKGYLTFRELVGSRWVSLDRECLPLRELIERLAGEIGENFAAAIYEPGSGAIRRQVAILVNGMHYTHLPDGLDTQLKNGDEVSIFPPISGGGETTGQRISEAASWQTGK